MPSLLLLLALLLQFHNSAAVVEKCCEESLLFNSTSLKCVLNNTVIDAVNLPQCQNSSLIVIPYDDDLDEPEGPDFCANEEASSGANVAVICKSNCNMEGKLCVR